jgi:uncharacterized protein
MFKPALEPQHLALLQKAKNGDPNASFRLGLLYSQEGRLNDQAAALFWFMEAAERGNANAQLLLALAYLNAAGVKKNNLAAAFWCQKAAWSGNMDAQLLFSLLYQNGEGVKKNPHLALFWYQQSRKDTDAQAWSRVSTPTQNSALSFSSNSSCTTTLSFYD